MSKEPSGLVMSSKQVNLGLVKRYETYYVLVSHEEISSLIGRLMQLCELIGDIEQRTALKAEIKQRVRSWLDDEYYCAGYDKFGEIRQGTKITEIN